MIRHVAFCQPIPILGTSKRADQFMAPEWVIEELTWGVRLTRPASQNVTEVPRFDVRGVGYCIRREDDHAQAEADGAPGTAADDDAPSAAAVVARAVGADARGSSADQEQAQGDAATAPEVTCGEGLLAGAGGAATKGAVPYRKKNR